MLATLKKEIGELSKVKRIIRLEGTLWVDESFKEHPKCLNGASDLINEAFDQLPERWRQVLVAVEIEGRRPAQLARWLPSRPEAPVRPSHRLHHERQWVR